MAPAFRRGDENRPQRWILASSRVDGTAVPGSLSEGAAERSEAEGVSFVGCFGPLVYHAAPLALKFLSGYVHRRTLPQSRFRSTAPSGREPGGVRTIQCAARKPWGCGRFSSPLRRLCFFYISPFIGVLAKNWALIYFRRFAISFPSKLKVTSVFLWVRL